jgi:hypothetical protein
MGSQPNVAAVSAYIYLGTKTRLLIIRARVIFFGGGELQFKLPLERVLVVTLADNLPTRVFAMLAKMLTV